MKDPYIYTGTSILKNKKNIRDEKLLKEVEANYTANRINKITKNFIKGEFDFLYFCKIHEFIFQDIFEWAGEPLKINIVKEEPSLGGISIEYANFTKITTEAEIVLNEMCATNWQAL